MLSPSSTNFFAGLTNQVVVPDAAAITLKDNTVTYGPWYTIGADGKTRFEHDESLTPWNYAGFAGMNAAATAKILESASFMMATELGSITIPGSPAIQIGGELTAGGPIISNIGVTIGTEGVTTTYTMRTYTPKLGLFARSNSDRFNNINKSLYQQRRLIKQLYRDATSPVPFGGSKTADEKSLFNDFRGRRDVRASLSPHEMIFMQGINNMGYRDLSIMDISQDPSGDMKLYKGAFDTYNNITSYFSADPEKGDYNDFAKVAVTIDQLFVPFVPGPTFDNLSDIQQKFFPRPYQNNSGLVNTTLNWPLMFDYNASGTLDIGTSGVFGTANDTTPPQYSWLTPSQQYGSGMIAWRSPVFIAGPGFTDAGVMANGSISGVDLQKPSNWVVGPLNIQWDEMTHSWLAVSRPQPTLIIARVLGLVANGFNLSDLSTSNLVNNRNAVDEALAFSSSLGTAYVAILENLVTNSDGYYGTAPPITTKIIFFNPFNYPVIVGNIVGLTITQNGYAVLTNTLQINREVISSITCANNALMVGTLPISVQQTEGSINSFMFDPYQDAAGNWIGSINAVYNQIDFMNHGLLIGVTQKQNATPNWSSGTISAYQS